MSLSKRHGTTKRHNEQNETVLVLTDGSKRAKRVVEWELIFAEVPRSAVRRIDVIDCLDSGVIIHRHDKRTQNEREHKRKQLGRQLTSGTTEHEPTLNREHDPAVDVLHGVPHEALLDYAAANAIDSIVIGVSERTRLDQSFIGTVFVSVSRTATIPVVIINS